MPPIYFTWLNFEGKNIGININFSYPLKPGLHFERKSTAHTQTVLRTWGAFSRPPMPIYAVGIAQVPSVNTPTIRRLLRVDAGLSLANSPQTYAYTQCFTRHIK